jgi:hypothetical protein
MKVTLRLLKLALLMVCVSGARGALATDAGANLRITIDDGVVMMTVAGVPSVYLDGTIDPDAPRRFAQLVADGRIPLGSNVYLNSPGGDLEAGLRLGRLFRASQTQTWVAAQPDGNGKQGSAYCASACAYAYLGGKFRIAPSSTEHYGVHQFYVPGTSVGDVSKIEQVSADIVQFLRDMGIDPGLFSVATAAAPTQVYWFSGEEMLQYGLANNGVLPMAVSYKLVMGTPYLLLDQDSHDGEHKITLLCSRGEVAIGALYIVGHERAQELVSAGRVSYLEVDERPVLPSSVAAEGSPPIAVVSNRAVAFDRQVDLKFLSDLLSAHSIGAYINHKNGTLRFGFTMSLSSAQEKLHDFYENCSGR